MMLPYQGWLYFGLPLVLIAVGEELVAIAVILMYGFNIIPLYNLGVFQADVMAAASFVIMVAVIIKKLVRILRPKEQKGRA